MAAIYTSPADCATRAKAGGGGGTTPSDPPPPEDTTPSNAPGGDGLLSIPECADYSGQLQKLRACPKYPRKGADSMIEGLEHMDRALRASPASRDAWVKSCADGAAAVKKILAAMCP